jgi:peptide/nickel transport system ATP-binding protein
MQIIFQDPNSSLNPRKNVEDTILEPLKLANKKASRAELNEKIEALMSTVGIDRRMRRAYPHELDGGRRQRVVIARALSMGPKFIACDEPVSALDVSIQAQILNLLQDLQEHQGLTYMFVTHDMSVVHHLATNILVMYLGQVVELCATREIFQTPIHPYTKALLSAVPTINFHNKRQRIITKGEIVSPINPKPGCRFAARCEHVCEACHAPQQLTEVSPNHFVACCRAKEIG